jgi:hypothetical protein
MSLAFNDEVEKDEPPQPRPGQPFQIWEGMVLVVGVAAGLAMLVLSRPDRGVEMIFPGITFLLGGLGLVGVPLLLSERLRRGPWRCRPWGAGKHLWFSTGTASWLMWPPIIIRKASAGANNHSIESIAPICFVYGTPLMALYVVLALLAGRRLRFRRRLGREIIRRPTTRSWRERFGLLLGLAWACTGLWVLTMVYHDDFQ